MGAAKPKPVKRTKHQCQEMRWTNIGYFLFFSLVQCSHIQISGGHPPPYLVKGDYHPPWGDEGMMGESRQFPWQSFYIMKKIVTAPKKVRNNSWKWHSQRGMEEIDDQFAMFSDVRNPRILCSPKNAVIFLFSPKHLLFLHFGKIMKIQNQGELYFLCNKTKTIF